jgi:hypothetical protein
MNKRLSAILVMCPNDLITLCQDKFLYDDYTVNGAKEIYLKFTV